MLLEGRGDQKLVKSSSPSNLAGQRFSAVNYSHPDLQRHQR